MSVQQMYQIVSQGVVDAWARIITFLPNLIGALVTIVVGLVIALVLRWVVVQILDAVRLQSLSDRVKFTDVLTKMGVKATVTELIADLVKWVVIIVFILPAVNILGLAAVGEVLDRLLGYIPEVVAAAVIVFLGFVLAEVTSNLVKGTAVSVGTTTAQVLAAVVRYAVLTFIFIAALIQLRVAPNLLQILFTGFVAMVAIAGGLAFGLGGKDLATDLLKRLREDFARK